MSDKEKIDYRRPFPPIGTEILTARDLERFFADRDGAQWVEELEGGNRKIRQVQLNSLWCYVSADFVRAFILQHQVDIYSRYVYDFEKVGCVDGVCIVTAKRR